MLAGKVSFLFGGMPSCSLPGSVLGRLSDILPIFLGALLILKLRYPQHGKGLDCWRSNAATKKVWLLPKCVWMAMTAAIRTFWWYSAWVPEMGCEWEERHSRQRHEMGREAWSIWVRHGVWSKRQKLKLQRLMVHLWRSSCDQLETCGWQLGTNGDV